VIGSLQAVFSVDVISWTPIAISFFMLCTVYVLPSPSQPREEIIEYINVVSRDGGAETSQVAKIINLSAYDSRDHKVDIRWTCVSAPKDFLKPLHQILDIAES
jgi:hypothetical protein